MPSSIECHDDLIETRVDEHNVESYTNENDNFRSGRRIIEDLEDVLISEKALEYFITEDMNKWGFKFQQLCCDFYREYAKVKGFGVRKIGARLSRKDKHPTSMIIKCAAEGERHQGHLERKDKVRKPKEITRFKCEAEIRFKWISDGDYWIVTKFLAEHTHTLSKPEHIMYFRSHRYIPDDDQVEIQRMHGSGVAPSGIMRTMVKRAGCHQDVGFIKDDVKNYLKKVRKKAIQDGDAETVLAYLTGKKSLNSSNFVRYTKDEEGRLENLFWCDNASRLDYKTFGNVLVFDSTYKCNAYNKPLVVLVGVNHNRKTVLFGCALVLDEKESSFIWVLEQLVLSGDGQKPETILTDGDRAMANAIGVVFPEARHRLCLWYLMRNVKANGGVKFCSGFIKCVNKYLTEDDFERGWEELMAHYGFKDKKWAKEMYNDKKKWAEPYLRGLRSTQRCESMHRTIKMLMKSNIKLYKLVELYDQVIAEQRIQDGQSDYTTIHTDPLIEGAVLYNVRSHASKVYTRNCFHILCKELSFESLYIVKGEKRKNERDAEPIYYWLNEVEHEDRRYVVIRHDASEMMYCCCMKLESVGFPCRHMFAVMKYTNMKQIPNGCILRRWTIGAKDYISVNENGNAYQEEQNNIKVDQKLNNGLVGIADPRMIVGRGAPKGKKTNKSAGKQPIKDFDLNKVYSTSPQKNIVTNSKSIRDKLLLYMPNTYINGEISQVEYSEEVEELDNRGFSKHQIVDWFPKQEW